MSEAGAAVQESEVLDRRALAARRFNVVVVLIALGTLGIVLFWVSKAVASIRRAADEAEGAFGLLAPPRRRSRRKPRRRRIARRR